MAAHSIMFVATLAFLAGVSSLGHPCSLSLLPGYIAYLVGSKSPIFEVFSGVVFTSGIVTTLAILGALLSSIGSFIMSVLPWVQIVVAIAIIFLGVAQIIDLNLPSFSPRMKLGKGYFGLYLLGAGFGLVISACTAPVFISVILYAFISGFQNGIVALVSYGLGMGIVFTATSVITLKAKKSLMNKITQHSIWINRVMGSILVIAGLYIAYISLHLI